MRLVKLTGKKSPNALYLNPRHIVIVDEADDPAGTSVLMMGDYRVWVAETPDEVAEKIAILAAMS